jgi:hypothetical protein
LLENDRVAIFCASQARYERKERDENANPFHPK